MHRTGVPRYLLTLLLGGLASTAAAESLEPGPDEALLYYQRNDNAYVGWGLHLWNTPQCTGVRDGTRWDQPPAAAGVDPEYGAWYRIPLNTVRSTPALANGAPGVQPGLRPSAAPCTGNSPRLPVVRTAQAAPRKQRRDQQRQLVPLLRILAQTDMAAHRPYHRRKKPAASSKPTCPRAMHRLRKDCTWRFCAASANPVRLSQKASGSSARLSCARGWPVSCRPWIRSN